MFHLWKAHPKDLRLRQLCAPQGSIRSCASLHVSFHSWDPYKPYILWHNERDFTNTTSATPNPRTKKIDKFCRPCGCKINEELQFDLADHTHFAKMSKVGQGSDKLFGSDFSCLTSLALQFLKHVMQSCNRRIHCRFRVTVTLGDSGLIVTAGFCHRIHEVCQVLPKAGVKNPAMFMASYGFHAWASKSLIFLAFARNGWNGWNGWYWERLQAEKVKWHDVMTSWRDLTSLDFSWFPPCGIWKQLSNHIDICLGIAWCICTKVPSQIAIWTDWTTRKHLPEIYCLRVMSSQFILLLLSFSLSVPFMCLQHIFIFSHVPLWLLLSLKLPSLLLLCPFKFTCVDLFRTVIICHFSSSSDSCYFSHVCSPLSFHPKI